MRDCNREMMRMWGKNSLEAAGGGVEKQSGLGSEGLVRPRGVGLGRGI
jgi:hypothetical protein